MSDGQISIAISVDGKDIVLANKNIDNLAKGSQTATSSIKNMALSFGLVKVASAAFNVLKNSMDAAIGRFDTMQKFPKVMESLGFSARESSSSINKLADGIEGLPTTLNDVVAQTQQLTAITGDLDKSTDTVLALNNAFLASGASSEDASRGMIQYNQMLAKGTVDMQSWRSLQETMPLGLQKTAEAMGFVGKTAQKDLYAALQSGEKTFDEFNDALIELGTGTGILADLARTNSEGIATSFSNLKNATVKGLANMLDALNEVSKAATGKSIAKNLDGLKVVVNATFSTLNNMISKSTPIVKMFVTILSTVISTAKTLMPVLVGLASAFAMLKAVQAVNNLIKTTDALMIAAGMSGKDLSIVIKAVATAQEISTGATKADILIRAAQNGQITLGTALIGVLTGGISASTVATTLMTAAVGGLKAALTILMGPIGWIAAGIAAVTAVMITHSKKQKENKAQIEQEVAAYKELNNSVADNAIQRQKVISNSETEQAITNNLIGSLEDLYNKTDLTKAKKAELSDIVDQLNNKFSDLNLTYNEETGYLNQSIELIKQKTAAYEAQEKVKAYNEAITENLKEQIQLESQAKAIKEEIARLEEEIASGSADNWGKNTLALKENQTLLDETLQLMKENEAQYIILADGRIAKIQEATEEEQKAIEATKAANESAVVSYSQLDEAGKAAMDSLREKYNSLKDTATDAFNRINEKSELSVAQMTENMAENQRIISEWATNIDTLAKRGLDEGLLERLRQAGPESAGQVNALVNASDEEFQRFNEVAGKAGETATNALSKSLDLGKDGITEAAMGLVTQAKETLSEQIGSSNFEQLGLAIPQGAAAGVEQGADEVNQSVSTLAEGLPSKFAGPLGIHSPSRVFMEFGQNIIDGLVLGIIGGTGKVAVSMALIVSVIENSMNNINVDSSGAMNGFVSSITSGMARASVAVLVGTSVMRASFSTFNNQIVSQGTTGMARYTQVITNGMNRSSQSVLTGTLKMNIQFMLMKTVIIAQSQQAMNGFVSAFSSGTSRALAIIISTRIAMTASMMGLNAQFFSAGMYASMGLASGINAGAGSAIAAAQSVASRVAATMKSALKIKSPSRVMRDEIGRYIPEGVAVGIDRYSNKAYEAMNRLSTGLMSPISPEIASGAYNIGLTSGVVNNINNFYNNQNESKDKIMEVSVPVYLYPNAPKEIGYATATFVEEKNKNNTRTLRRLGGER